MIKKGNKPTRRHSRTYSYVKEGKVKPNTACKKGYEKYTELNGWTCTDKPKKLFRPELDLRSTKTHRNGMNRGYAPKQFKLNNKLHKKLQKLKNAY